MNTQSTAAVATLDRAEKPATDGTAKTVPGPFFVEAEKMLERFAEVTRETAKRAFHFFQERGGEFGKELDDWFKAESEILRPVAVEMSEDEKFLTVKAAIPGFTTDQIEISVEDNLLVISGKAEKKEEKTENNILYSDWKSDRFFRTLSLPSSVDPSNVKAELKDGILTVTLPKVEPKMPIKIEVTTK